MKRSRADGGGAIHLTVWVPYERAGRGPDRGGARGGRPDGARHVRSIVVDLADAAGNEVDIATTKGRD
ncbi:MAG: hypothetical protein ACRDF0_09730 [Candidatus Limnocylindria bacterium]